MPSLYELLEETAALEAALDETEGDLPPDLEAEFDALVRERGAKVDNLARVIRSWLATEEAIEDEVAHLQSRKNVIARRRARLERMILQVMGTYDAKRLRGEAHELVAKASGSRAVEVLVEPDQLPEAFVREVVKRELVVDKKALKDALDATSDDVLRDGADIPIARLAPAKVRLEAK